MEVATHAQVMWVHHAHFLRACFRRNPKGIAREITHRKSLTPKSSHETLEANRSPERLDDNSHYGDAHMNNKLIQILSNLSLKDLNDLKESVDLEISSRLQDNSSIDSLIDTLSSTGLKVQTEVPKVTVLAPQIPLKNLPNGTQFRFPRSKRVYKVMSHQGDKVVYQGVGEKFSEKVFDAKGDKMVVAQ